MCRIAGRTVFLAAGIAALIGSGVFFSARSARSDAPASQPSASSPAMAPSEEGVRNFTILNIEYEGSKVWVPGTLIVKKGDKVKVKLINNAPSGDHGWAVEKYLPAGVVVHKGTPATAEFTADTAGVFRIYCQMHPAHVGGQLWVME